MTKLKSLLLAAALGLTGMTVASATTYNLTLAAPTQAGSARLAPGAYRLNVNGQIAIFTNVETNKSVMTVVHVEGGVNAHERTRIELKDENGSQRMESMELENSVNTLEF